jgi:mono/diheme cytochrome c family protein
MSPARSRAHRTSKIAIPAALIGALFAAATGSIAHAHQGHGAGHPHPPTRDELAAFERAKPAFERHCFRCHTIGGKKSKAKALAHMAMDGYPFGGHHADEAGEVVKKVLGAGGGKATMPSDAPGSVTGEDLAAILAWADAYDAARRARRTEPE